MRALGGGIFAAARRTGIRAGGAEVVIEIDEDQDPSVYLRGRVLLPDGRPAKAATMNPIFGSNGVSPIETLDPVTGTFDLGPYPPGDWVLRFHLVGYPDLQFGPMRVDPQGVWEVGEVKFAEGGTLRALFHHGEQVSVEKLELAVLRGTRPDWRAMEFANDVATSTLLAPGDYALYWEGETLAANGIPFTIHSGVETLVNVTLAAGSAHELIVVEDEPSDLRVLEITLREEATAQILHMRMNRWRDPEFRRTLHLAPGKWTIEVSAADGRGAAGTLRVEQGGAAQELRLILSAAE